MRLQSQLPFFSEPDAKATRLTTPLNSSYQESKARARRADPSVGCGGGICWTIASSTAVTPVPAFAETGKIGSPSSRRLETSLFVPSTFEFGRSIYERSVEGTYHLKTR